MRQVNSLKHLYEEIETFKQPSAWTKVKSLVGKLGQPKSATQMKNELRNLKDFYKQAKDNNKRTIRHVTELSIKSFIIFLELGMY